MRRMSTSPLTSENKASGNSEPPLGASGSFLDIRIPPPELNPEPPVQVVSVLITTSLCSLSIFRQPYVPDFWDSAEPIPDIPSMGVPIVVVVGGTETSHGSVLPHAPEDINMPLESDSTQVSQKAERSDSFLDDVADDLHLPPIQEIKSSLLNIFS